MKLFADLYTALDEPAGTGAKTEALVGYWRSAPPEDAAWAVSLLTGRKPRQAVPALRLRQWAAREAGIPDWLFDASYRVVGDLAETIGLVLPPANGRSLLPLSRWVTERLLPLRGMAEPEQRKALTAAWRELDRDQRLVWNKLVTGGFQAGVPRKLVIQSLARAGGVTEAVIAHRLTGRWEPRAGFFDGLFSPETKDADVSRPYPFRLACPLEGDVAELGEIGQWQAELQWDGIRAQLVRRGGQVFLWSCDGELITEKFPEIAAAAGTLPEGTVIDGEILAWKEGRPLGFSQLKRRIRRTRIDARLCAALPAVLMAGDLLESGGEDLRDRGLTFRSAALEDLLARASDPRLRRSPSVPAGSWEDLARARQNARRLGARGLTIKRRASAYRAGRGRGDWWKWAVDPLSVDAVLIYAQAGHGGVSGLFTDYTFAVWQAGALVPFAKACTGLSEEETREVDRFIRANTLERFGPVRSVRPELVFEIAFEGIRPSPRHRSGVAVRSARIARRRADKAVAEADTLERVMTLLSAPPGPTEPA
jgi:DNA ligase-1